MLDISSKDLLSNNNYQQSIIITPSFAHKFFFLYYYFSILTSNTILSCCLILTAVVIYSIIIILSFTIIKYLFKQSKTPIIYQMFVQILWIMLWLMLLNFTIYNKYRNKYYTKLIKGINKNINVLVKITKDKWIYRFSTNYDNIVPVYLKSFADHQVITEMNIIFVKKTSNPIYLISVQPNIQQCYFIRVHNTTCLVLKKQIDNNHQYVLFIFKDFIKTIKLKKYIRLG